MTLNVCPFSETLCGSRYSLLSVWGPGPWGVSGHAPHSVQHHDHRSSTIPAEEHLGKAHLPSYPGFWDPPLDVFHPSCCHWEVRKTPGVQEHHRRFTDTTDIKDFRWLRYIYIFKDWAISFIFTGCSIITQWLSSGISSSASTSLCLRIRSVVDTLQESLETSSLRNSIILTCSSSKGEHSLSLNGPLIFFFK